VSRITQHSATATPPALQRAVAAAPEAGGKPFTIHPDLGCIVLCDVAPDPVDDPAPVAAPSAAPIPVAAATTRPPAVIARPQVTIGSTQQVLINSDRAAAGLAPLSWSGCLAGIAASWASYMARTGVFQHGPGVNQDFGCGLGSRQCGENIAWMTGGPNDAQANSMFMNSPEHRANILGPYRYVGTAWATASGKSYIVEEFG
jgi:uncharacterized protein YkwD